MAVSCGEDVGRYTTERSTRVAVGDLPNWELLARRTRIQSGKNDAGTEMPVLWYVTRPRAAMDTTTRGGLCGGSGGRERTWDGPGGAEREEYGGMEMMWTGGDGGSWGAGVEAVMIWAS